MMLATSKTEQVSGFLRRAIIQGEYKPGCRLDSVRDLAQKFGVSTRIISCVLDILQNEKLVSRTHGKGVFVNDWQEQDGIEVYMLLWGIQGTKNNYLDEVIKIACPPVLREGFSFNIRAVQCARNDFDRLELELQRIESNKTAKCVLANTTAFGQEQIELLKELNLPVLFFGDSGDASLDNVEFNQITGDNRLMGQRCAEFVSQGFGEITLFTLTRQTYFYDLFCQGAEAFAEHSGIKLNIIEFPSSIHSGTMSHVESVYHDLFAEAAEKKWLEHPVLFNALNEDFFMPLLETYKRIPNDKPVAMAGFDANYFKVFYNAVFDRLYEVVTCPDKTHKQVLEVPIVITDFSNGKKYHSYQNQITQL